jgi:predicted RNase H-like nuclease (RuvC/YqgF family)
MMSLSIFSQSLLRLTALAAVLGFTAYCLPAQDQSTDDVAAAARKARAQQKTAPAPKKVITNDDIPAAKNTAPAADADADASSKGDSAQAGGKAEENDPKSEAYWKKRFQEARDKISQSEKELDVMQRELEKDQVQYYNDPQKALMQQHDRSDINDKTGKIDAKKKEIETLKQQLSDMEDEMRKAGGDPGWAR